MVMYWRKVILAAALSSILDVSSEQFGNDDHSKQLLEHLTESEKIFLFGANPSEAQFEVAHLKQPKRRKRSLLYDDQDLVGLKKHLDIKLSPRNSFLDPQFLLMRRWSNNTELVLDQHADEEVDSCYYRGDNAALYVCDDVRGLVRSNDTYYFIHPLPDRFHDDHAKAHVIVKKQMNENKDDDDSCIERDNIIDDPQPANTWKKHRRKREVPSNVNNNLEGFKVNLAHRNKTITDFIQKLSNGAPRQRRAILPAVFVETAVFVDRDLYKHMTINFPKDTERELVRFVLAMINAVQLIYHDPSLGRPVNFILKRLEILHEDPANLKRPHDIDRFLSNFCTWQRLENPPGDNDPLHWDHALILTGLDLYVVNKNGKVSSQVVGLAPVAGMCTVTSSCTVNEGRHFESVYVVAHEIGHNLGMRHDGPLADNGCDPSAYIMSPTLGSGKITWSQCSKNYLQKFLDTVQSRCLLDHGNSAGQLDHSAEGILPGERFDADQQCMLKYGRGSRHSGAQSLEDICRDLHCQRERYTWTSHPALEGTRCGEDMYCRGGECVEREGSTVVRGAWGRWSGWSECASACLVDDTHAPAAAGVAVATRRCNRARHEKNHCVGHDKKYQSCHAQQCSNVPRMTVREFADQICLRARDVDPDLIGTGLQRIDSDDVSSACAVWCDTRGGGYKSRGWALPDGTACSTAAPMFCISGVCQKFTCSSNPDTEFSLKPSDCEWEALRTATPPTTSTKTSGTWRRAVGGQWRPASGCHYHCISPGAGVRLVTATSRDRPLTSIQLCSPDSRPESGCTQRKSPYQYATMVCTKYKDRVRRLSGLGMQISPALEDPDRPCRIACQDERVSHRFYLVNGHEGWFPLGTSCGKRNASYCVSGKCLEFGPDNTPVSEMVFTLPLLSRGGNASVSWRTSRSVSSRHRRRRSLGAQRITVKATLDQTHLDDIIARLNLTHNLNDHITYFDTIPEHIELDFSNPIHIAPEDTLLRKKPRPTWD
ncbi:A disintegrin and metalloproteinase with thrombospondin motifs 16 isoform X2 [Spodoptera frugiperda]|uniref:A disintegrin and metalloproteinase with thrombospondin motifs 16 isoform X1 n=1 Tax=Spodoptera frugiperda TaxID=7108 RepID=A0A9R0DQG2_SPOFR|nr:A disintegrin and metalloproteinase with thrombospondin motifs 16 isoform X1 [Spodoptera frugiperda]XP_050551062.1 A disintegrin and metalloproteinase with thrombospondin motifs 16 isoform X2 [Spodoptera frugiperda]